MKLLNPSEMANIVQRRTLRARPEKFETMFRKAGSTTEVFFGGFEKAASKMDTGAYLRKVYERSKNKTKSPNWTPSSEKTFHQVMKEETPRIPAWKLKMQHA